MYKTCTLNGKELKTLCINGKTAYAAYEDRCTLFNNYALSSCGLDELSALGSDSYTYNGNVYNYTIYETYAMPACFPLGAGNTNPWYITPNCVATAAHWSSSLPTGTWTSSSGNTYDVSAWTNLKDWALSNGWTTEEVNKMTSINDVVVAVQGQSKSSSVTQDTSPYFMSKETLKKWWWRRTLDGTVGWHAPQKGINVQGSTYAVPVVMQSDYSWSTPKTGYATIDSRSAALKAKCEAIEPTYLAYVGDSGKPTWIWLGREGCQPVPIVVSQCFSQFAGPDWCSIFPVIKKFIQENDYCTLNEVTDEMLSAAS